MVRAAERRIFIGVDLGKMRDFTAVAVLERYSEWARWNPVLFCDEYESRAAVRMLERVRLGTSYPRVVERIREVAAQAAQEGPCTVVVDATGVGVPVVDALREARMACDLVGVTMTAGERSTRVRGGWNVPKKEVMVGLQMMFARGELQIARDMPLSKALVDELAAMGKDMRAVTGHDDLVMAVGLACWRLRARGTVGERGERLI